MITPTRRSSAIVLGLALAAIAATSGMANSAASAVQCGIAASSERGMLALEGTVLSPVAMSGEYRFAIRSSSSGGSSNVSQGGYFTANANEATPLGKVLINAGSSYDVVFDVTADGKTLECDQDMASLR
ncbi:curli-like amyloid fiber formation chaperone CsgH [Devosia sp.]|uniref:curli-like amyloid fiber formation chaperone CsgH n=1 Tax=Devosia sp. TaxID=1871048 RepID=UPI002FC98356